MSALVRYLGDAATGRAGGVLPLRLRDPAGAADLCLRGELVAAVRTERPFGHIGRGSSASPACSCNFAALARLPLADANALSFASPLITVALAALILKERVRVYRWSAVAIGFVGVLVMLWPYLDVGHMTASDAGERVGARCALTAAFTNAGSVIQTRRLTESETTSSIVFYFSLICMLFGRRTLPFAWHQPTRREFAALVASALSAASRISSSPRAIATRPPRWWRRSTIRRCCGRSCSATALFGEFPTPLSSSARPSSRRRPVRDLARAPARPARWRAGGRWKGH